LRIIETDWEDIFPRGSTNRIHGSYTIAKNKDFFRIRWLCQSCNAKGYTDYSWKIEAHTTVPANTKHKKYKKSKIKPCWL
jgi:hypothetical protein